MGGYPAKGAETGAEAEERVRGGCKINRKERKERKDLRKMRRLFVISAFFAVTPATATQ